MIEVPKEFQKREREPYPITNKIEFEYWFIQKFKEVDPVLEWEFLPITWTEIQRFANQSLRNKLQNWLNNLPKKRYFTIVQHDHGIEFDLGHLDILVYASGKYNPEYYPIPLIYKDETLKHEREKDLILSFIGNNTHPVRKQLEEIYYNVYLTSYDRSNFKDLINRSLFSLCPRGYGETSFRIQEALQCGSIPVYVSDYFIEPFNIPFETYGIKVHLHQVNKIDKLVQIDTNKLAAAGKKIYQKYFTYEGCFNTIINTLR